MTRGNTSFESNLKRIRYIYSFKLISLVVHKNFLSFSLKNYIVTFFLSCDLICQQQLELLTCDLDMYDLRHCCCFLQVNTMVSKFMWCVFLCRRREGLTSRSCQEV